MNTDKPIGWNERYEMVSADMMEPNGAMSKVKQWIASGRGIAVWINQDLSGNCGHKIFTPGDCGKPHWAYGLVEVLPDDSRIDYKRQEVIRDKPKSKMKAAELRQMNIDGWTYDKRMREWYRDISVK